MAPKTVVPAVATTAIGTPPYTRETCSILPYCYYYRRVVILAFSVFFRFYGTHFGDSHQINQIQHLETRTKFLLTRTKFSDNHEIAKISTRLQ